MAFLRIYETIFQFWNHDKQCYLSNDAILKRAGLTSIGGLSEAFIFFEKHGELKRKYINGKRYLIQPERIIEAEDLPVDNKNKCSTKIKHPLTDVRPPSHRCETPPLTDVRHNNKKIKEKNLIREREPLPDDFAFDDDQIRRCNEINVSPAIVLEKFKIWSKGKLFDMDEWKRQAILWVLREKPEKKGQKNDLPKKNIDESYAAVNRMREFVSQKNILRT
jgi:hypothetical protein